MKTIGSVSSASVRGLLLAGCVLAAGAAAAVTFDFAKGTGPVPLVHGLARPPYPAYDNWGLGPTLREANVPYLYLHNTGGAFGAGAFADISNLFPKFEADENDPASYDFMVTDNLLQQMIRSKLAPVFRLGESEEERADLHRYRTFPPKDAAKWARVCEHVIRHYNHFWNNGFRYEIEYWPIWHAPDRATCWSGTMEEFIGFYATVATHLKAKFPALKIGGCGFAGPVDGFLAAVRARNLPLDFLSFEARGDAAAVARRLAEVKAALARAGLARTEPMPIVLSTAKPGSMRSAAEIAANFALFANEGVPVALTGEPACAASNFNLFLSPLPERDCPRQDKRLRAFQSLVAYDRLYAYRERAAFTRTAADGDLVITAVRDAYGAGAAMFVNLSDRPQRLVLDAPGYETVGVESFDAERNLASVPLPDTLAPDRVLLVRFRKKGLEKPVPLEKADGFAIDFAHATGPVKPVNGVGQGPMVGYDYSLFRHLADARVPLARLHDTGGSQGRCVFADVSNLFPDFAADETDPANYRFAFTDDLTRAFLANGVKLYFRLGETIETRSFYRRYRTEVPPDPAKWARICEHIVRHYQEGWANGFTNAIAFAEIWNEPDGTEKPMYNGLWHGTFAQFLELYGVASRHLKAKFPTLPVGGYGSTGFGGAFAGQPSDRARYLLKCFLQFVDYAKANKCPVDFFSYHCYGDADEQDPIMRFVRKRLDAAGFTHTQIHNTEWKAGWGLGSAWQAAATAAVLCAFQNGPMDAATIYDGRCGPSEYSPLFNAATLAPHKAYYAFRMFGELVRDGTSVKATADATRRLRLAAARDAHGKGHALFVNWSKEAVPFEWKAPGWKAVSFRLLDATHDDESAPCPAKLVPNQCVLVTFERE